MSLDELSDELRSRMASTSSAPSASTSTSTPASDFEEFKEFVYKSMSSQQREIEVLAKDVASVKVLQENFKSSLKMLQDHNKYNISAWDVFLCILAPVLFVADVGSDIYTARTYYSSGKMMEFGWTCAFIFLPGVANTVLYVTQESFTSRKNTRPMRLELLVLLLPVAPLVHYIKALYYTVKWYQTEDYSAKRIIYDLKKNENIDAIPVRTVECFLEAAPQLVLQIILVLRADDIRVFQIITICTSALGMLPAIYAFLNRFVYHWQIIDKYFWLGTVLLTLGHYLVTLSRVISIAMIACVLRPACTVVACGCHILVMATSMFYFVYRPVPVVDTFAKMCFSVVFGAILLFSYITPSLRYPILSSTVYHALCFLENIICIVIWFAYASDEMKTSYLGYPVLEISIAAYCIGVGLVMGYFICIYPMERDPNLQRYNDNTTQTSKMLIFLININRRRNLFYFLEFQNVPNIVRID